MPKISLKQIFLIYFLMFKSYPVCSPELLMYAYSSGITEAETEYNDIVVNFRKITKQMSQTLFNDRSERFNILPIFITVKNNSNKEVWFNNSNIEGGKFLSYHEVAPLFDLQTSYMKTSILYFSITSLVTTYVGSLILNSDVFSSVIGGMIGSKTKLKLGIILICAIPAVVSTISVICQNVSIQKFYKNFMIKKCAILPGESTIILRFIKINKGQKNIKSLIALDTHLMSLNIKV